MLDAKVFFESTQCDEIDYDVTSVHLVSCYSYTEVSAWRPQCEGAVAEHRAIMSRYIDTAKEAP